MQLQRIELFRYKPFLPVQTELLEIDFVSNIQNIIGTNGSGKTTLLKELNPKPAVRTDYGEDGYKKIFLVHENSEYILTSDFTNTSSPHSFIKDGLELNSSGTTSVQEELVTNHLGYSTQVHNICYGNFKLSESQVGSRKTYLLTIHPCQMKMILDYHKKINTSLRACRDNITMLHERRAALITQLIPDELRAELSLENEKLTNELGCVVDAIHKLNNQKNNILTTLSTKDRYYVPKTKKDILKVIPSYTRYKDIPRDIQNSVSINTTTTEISLLSSKLETLSSRSRDLTLEIDKYEQYIKQNDAKGAFESIETAIKELYLDIQELEKVRIDNPFDKYILENIPSQISYLTDVISFFIGYNAPIPSLKQVNVLRDKLQVIKTKTYRIEQQANYLEEKLARYAQTLNSTLIHNVPDSCNRCILFQKYNESLTSAQSDYDSVLSELAVVRLRKKRLDVLLQGRSEKLSLYEVAVPQLQRISEYFSENGYLLTPLKDLDLINVLRKNPSLILVRLQRHYDLSKDHYTLIKKREILDKLLLEQEKLNTPSEFGQKFLEDMLSEKTTELESVRKDYVSCKSEKEEKERFLSLLNDYQKDLVHIQKEYEATKDYLNSKILEHEKELCDLYIRHLSSMKSSIVGRLTEIDRTLREQDGIRARYQDEVLVNIEKLSIQEAEYAKMEEALSPTKGIPHKYMVQFLNDVLTGANLFIQEIFSYPLEFILLEEEGDLDFKFKIKVEDVLIQDVSWGSDAQKEVCNFVFNLSLIIQLKQSLYPLLVDECGRTFDSYHKQKLVEFLKSIVDDGLVSQLFLINHHATISAGLLNSDTIVLSDSNIVVPEVYNEHVKIEKY